VVRVPRRFADTNAAKSNSVTAGRRQPDLVFGGVYAAGSETTRAPTFAGSYPDHALYKDPDLDEAETRETSLSRESGENGKERASRNPKVFAPLPTL
ncbi:hypothetical protein B296_00050145, partial [Ensete ventricosum]